MQRDLADLSRIPDVASVSVRTAWIFDLHLGTPGCRPDALLDFLKHGVLRLHRRRAQL